MASFNDGQTLVVAVVGIDGCGKSSAFRAALEVLARQIDVVGIGDEILAGAPGSPLRPRTDLPFARIAASVGRTAKQARQAGLYRQLKTLDLIGRSRTRDHVIRREEPAALLTDGDPLVNAVAWSIGRLYRTELQQDDERILDVLRYLAGDRSVPLREMPYYLRHAWQLAVVNRLHLARFRFPDVVIHLEVDGATAMERIRRRGRALQAHESEAALDELAAGYERVCQLLETRCGVSVVRISCVRTGKDEIATTVARTVLERLPESRQMLPGDSLADPIEVVATTMSGSLRDQRKVGLIGPEFSRVTRRPVRVHEAGTHSEAETIARKVVARGGRLLVSAGGAGTFNAVLEGCHHDGSVPTDLRLAFLRKGSADLIGKVLRVPDDLRGAVRAINDGLEQDRNIDADILAVETVGPDGRIERRHLVGFGGLGIFGDVPRFTESRAIKLYKGILSTLLGDYGPFYTGLALATARWYIQRLRGRVPALELELDGIAVDARDWSTVIVINGDLGRALPLGRGLPLASDAFRVVALRDMGLLFGLRQLAASRSGRILEEPERYGCLVREVKTFTARPSVPAPGLPSAAVMVNVDGLREISHGQVRFDLSGRVRLIAGPKSADV